jgi:hypothetical protein
VCRELGQRVKVELACGWLWLPAATVALAA